MSLNDPIDFSDYRYVFYYSSRSRGARILRQFHFLRRFSTARGALPAASRRVCRPPAACVPCKSSRAAATFTGAFPPRALQDLQWFFLLFYYIEIRRRIEKEEEAMRLLSAYAETRGTVRRRCKTHDGFNAYHRVCGNIGHYVRYVWVCAPEPCHAHGISALHNATLRR